MDTGIFDRYLSIDILYRNGVQNVSTRDITILLMLEGQAQLVNEGRRRIFNPDDIVIVNSGTPYSLMKIMPESSILTARFTLSSDVVEKLYGKRHLTFVCDSREDPEKREYSEMRSVMKEMLRDYVVNGGGESNLMQSSDFFRLLHIIVSYFMFQTDVKEDWEKERVDEIRNYLEQNYDSEIGLADTAEHLGLTEAYLARFFRKHFGTTLLDYLYDIRLVKAREDLEKGKSVTRTGYDNGFPNVATFTKRFSVKYSESPSSYQKRYLSENPPDSGTKGGMSREAKEKMMDYFETRILSTSRANWMNLVTVKCDAQKYEPYKSVWSSAINIGPAETLLNSDVQQAVLLAKKTIDLQYARIWSIFSDELYILSEGPNRFTRFFKVIDFLLGAGIKPIIELGEQRDWIRRTASSNIRESHNKTLFRDYSHFLTTLDNMMEALAFKYSVREVNTWAFELWDDRRIEVYHDKPDYITIYRNVRDTIHKHVPLVRIGGAGNYLGWSNSHTEASIKRWIDNSVYPDCLTFNYSPYRVQTSEDGKERRVVLKTDEDDLERTIDGLRQIMKKYGYPDTEIYINNFNMTESSSNYLNDSLWKAGYMAKCYINSIGKVSALLYSQLSDATTDYFYNQSFLNGSCGLITRDLIEKPAFLTLRLLRHLHGYLIQKDNGYMVTRDEYGNIAVFCYNFIGRSYLYYLKEEDENTLENHYSYFEHMEKKTFHFEIDSLPDNQEYTLHHHTVNRQSGSIMDEWARFDFLDYLTSQDFAYLRQICIPKLSYTRAKTKDGKLVFDLTLEPLEIRLVSIRRNAAEYLSTADEKSK